MDAKAFALRMLAVATAYAQAGTSRASTPDEVTRMLALFGLPYAENGVPVPFCDAGVGFSACKAYCDLMGIAYTASSAVSVFKSVLADVEALAFKPSAQCGTTRAAAVARGNWFPVAAAGDSATILPGWLVLFDFGGDDLTGEEWPDHIEIVRVDNGDTIGTIGFNTTSASETNGGVVAPKERNWDHIEGFIRTYEATA